MRTDLQYAIALLCRGRSRAVVMTEIAAILAALPVLWFVACTFVLLEPLS